MQISELHLKRGLAMTTWIDLHSRRIVPGSVSPVNGAELQFGATAGNSSCDAADGLLVAAFFVAVDAEELDEVFVELHPDVVVAAAHDAGEHLGLAALQAGE